MFLRYVLPCLLSMPERKTKLMRFFTQLSVRYRVSEIVGTAASILAKAPVRGGWRAPDGQVADIDNKV